MDFKSLTPREIEKFVRRHIYKKRARPPQPLDQLLQEFNLHINRFCPVQDLLIFLDDPTKKRLKLDLNQLVLVAGQGQLVQKYVGTPNPSNQGITGYVYRTNTPIHFPHRKKSEFQKIRRMGWEKHLPKDNFLAVPIAIRTSAIGVLYAITPLSKKSFTDSDVNIMTLLANLLSSTIQNIMDANRAYRLSITDNLTGLYNDRFFHESIQEHVQYAINRDENLHLVFMDLDNLKLMNDTKGHLAGSKILQEVGSIIDKTCKGKIIAARYGGDEFVLIIPQQSDRQVFQLAETIRKLIGKYTFLSKQYFGLDPIPSKGIITASFGISSIRRLHVSGAAEVRNLLIQTADAAMYKAKAAGKNRTIWHE